MANCGIILLMVAKKRILNKKNILIALSALIVVSGIIAAILYYTFAISNSKQATKEAGPEEKIAVIIDKAESTGGDAVSEKQELKKLAENETDKTKKDMYLSAIVDLYINTKDVVGSQAAAQEYEKSSGSAQSAEALAKSYSDAADYRNAAKYYGIAAERSEKPASENERAPYNDYMILKREAEAKIQ